MIHAPQDDHLYFRKINVLRIGTRRATGSPMPVLLLGLLLSAAATLTAGQALLREAAETNVNQRYLIESVSVSGVELDRLESARIPSSLRERLRSLVGQRCDMAALEELSAQIRRQLHFRTVSERLLRGSSPDRIKVDFDGVRGEPGFSVSLPKFLYNSDLGWTGEVDATTNVKNNKFTFGLVSNGDDLIERFSGVTARFDSQSLGSDKLHASVVFDDYHELWNPATEEAAQGTGLDLYRSRWSVAPQLTVAVAGPLAVSFGFSFGQTDSDSAAIGARSVNAATLDVRYERKIEGGLLGLDTVQQRIEGDYNLRLATRAIGSDYAYARHMISFKYEAISGRNVAADEFTAGVIAGQAPLFDRFVLGSSATLRGWDRYQIDPLGGTRVVHNEITYGYRVGEGTIEVLYDTGALWQSGDPMVFRHSAGVGYKQGVFIVTTAFPIRNGRIEPVFMAGMNY